VKGENPNAVKLREQSLLPLEKVRMRGSNKAFFLCLFPSPRPSPAGEGDFFLNLTALVKTPL